jgi:glutamyl-tRNA synthetase
MLESGSAYLSKEEAKEDGQRSEVIRFKNPNKKISFDDMIRGNIEFDTEELGDFVIAKSEDEPLYHLAVVVDDHEMGITHVIRGEDHISNTPRQILIQEAIGAIRPAYMHLPLIFDSDRKKLSKRKHGSAVWVDTYKEEGFLPDALLNFLALLGWNPGTEKEIFSLEELIQAFDLKGIQKSAAIFDIKKLRWINREHIKKLPENTLKNIIEGKIKEKFPDATIPNGISDIISERIETLGDVDSMINSGEVDYFFNEPDLEKSKIAWKEDSAETASENLSKIAEMLSPLDDFKSIESIKQSIMPFAEEKGKGSVLWPLRYSLSGQEKSPDPFTLLYLLGKEKSLKRIRRAITELE